MLPAKRHTSRLEVPPPAPLDWDAILAGLPDEGEPSPALEALAAKPAPTLPPGVCARRWKRCSMKSKPTHRFRNLYRALSPVMRAKARKAYRLWRTDPKHPGLEFKRICSYYSVRIDDDFRALAYRDRGQGRNDLVLDRAA